MIWQTFFSDFHIKDAVDILLLSVLFYYIIILIKGTRAVQIIQGVFVLLLILILAYYLKLKAIYWLMQKFLLALAVALPIVFQPELRRALEYIGRRGSIIQVGSPFYDKKELEKFLEEISWTCSLLSQTHTGALLVFEKATGLEDFIETGVKINAEISSKLLVSIFLPQSPLHDGAVILRGNKVIAASCYLPLSENIKLTLKKYMGSRHRAAIGITEQTDAVVVVVSEETGAVKVAFSGNMTNNLNPEQLKKVLSRFLFVSEEPRKIKISFRKVKNADKSL